MQQAQPFAVAPSTTLLDHSAQTYAPTSMNTATTHANADSVSKTSHSKASPGQLLLEAICKLPAAQIFLQEDDNHHPLSSGQASQMIQPITLGNIKHKLEKGAYKKACDGVQKESLSKEDSVAEIQALLEDVHLFINSTKDHHISTSPRFQASRELEGAVPSLVAQLMDGIIMPSPPLRYPRRNRSASSPVISCASSSSSHLYESKVTTTHLDPPQKPPAKRRRNTVVAPLSISPLDSDDSSSYSSSSSSFSSATLIASGHQKPKRSSKGGASIIPGRLCSYCAATTTPMWRHGPGKFIHLCNSCGVKWRRCKILQGRDYSHREPILELPASSMQSTFSSISSGNRGNASAATSGKSIASLNSVIHGSYDMLVDADGVTSSCFASSFQSGGSFSDDTVSSSPSSSALHDEDVFDEDFATTAEADDLQTVTENDVPCARTLQFTQLLNHLSPESSHSLVCILHNCMNATIKDKLMGGEEVAVDIRLVSAEVWDQVISFAQQQGIPLSRV